MNQRVYPDTWYLRKFVFDGQNSVERGYNINKQALVEILYHFGDQRKKKESEDTKTVWARNSKSSRRRKVRWKN